MMTRTQKLRLCTWARTDPVNLSEVNENFTLLDSSAGSALDAAEAALCCAAGQCLAARQRGETPLWEKRIWTAPLAEASECTQLDHVLFSEGRLDFLPSSSVQAEAALYRRPGVSYTSGVQFQFRTRAFEKMAELTALSGCCTLTGVQVSAPASDSDWDIGWYAHDGGYPIDCSFKLVLLENGEEKAVSDTVTLHNESKSSVTFAFDSVPLNPNGSYEFWVSAGNSRDPEDSGIACGGASEIAVSVTASPAASGSASFRPMALSADTRKLRLLVPGENPPQIRVSFDGGTAQTVTLADGEGSLSVPAGAAQAQVEAVLSAAHDALTGLAAVML